METWPVKGLPMWGMALLQFEGCIKVGCVVAHQKNTILGLESDQNQQADIPMCSLEMVTWVNEMNRRGSAAM